jgi:hypothetical protein
MLSAKAVSALQIACPNNQGVTPGATGTDGQEIANAINAAASLSPAADVAANSPASAVTVTTAGGDTYSDAAINTALASVITDLNSTRTQINAILTALKNANLMS